MSDRGMLVVLSGFSGVGKGTVVSCLMNRHEGYALSVSATTREPRAGEVHGREYFFCEQARFREMIEQDDLIEYALYCGNYYGTPRSFVEKKIAEGTDVILEIEIQGARRIREQYADAILIFLMPPSAGELMNRLSGRGTETADVVAARMERAAAEAEGIQDYDYILVNDVPEACADRMHQLVLSEHMRTTQNLPFIETIRRQLKDHVKGE